MRRKQMMKKMKESTSSPFDDVNIFEDFDMSEPRQDTPGRIRAQGIGPFVAVDVIMARAVEKDLQKRKEENPQVDVGSLSERTKDVLERAKNIVIVRTESESIALREKETTEDDKTETVPFKEKETAEDEKNEMLPPKDDEAGTSMNRYIHKRTSRKSTGQSEKESKSDIDDDEDDKSTVTGDDETKSEVEDTAGVDESK